MQEKKLDWYFLSILNNLKRKTKIAFTFVCGPFKKISNHITKYSSFFLQCSKNPLKYTNKNRNRCDDSQKKKKGKSKQPSSLETLKERMGTA